MFSRYLPAPRIMLAALAIAAAPSVAQAGAVIAYGNTLLGVNDSGELNFAGSPPPGYESEFPDNGGGFFGVYRVGYGDAISPGCLCEGWGVAATVGGDRIAGFANQSAGSGGLTGGTFGSTANTATSIIGLSEGPVQVQHLFGPSLAADTFQVNVRITNTSSTETLFDVVYRRAMDWDVPPTEFDEFVTHGGVTANLEANGGNVRHASDDGFASSDPRTSTFPINADTVDTDFVQNGPADHGSVFDFAFGDLAPGETREFNIFYGSAESQADALARIASVNANVYSLGQPNTNGVGGGGDEGGDDGGGVAAASFSTFDTPTGAGETPTFFFAFGGVGGIAPGDTEAFPILPFVPAPGEFEFPAPEPRRWYDPPFAKGFTYELEGGALFTSVTAPSTGYAGYEFGIYVDGILLGTILAGETFTFDDPIAKFDLIFLAGDPLDIEDPGFSTAFPTFLDWEGAASRLLMSSIIDTGTDVPEPATLVLLGGGLLAIATVRRRRRTRN